MKNLVLAMFLSLDGFIEGPNGTFVPPPFSPEVTKEWVDHNLREAKHLLYGRKNFEFNKSFWTSSAATGQAHTDTMNRLPKTVVSRTLAGDPGWNATHAKGSLTETIAKLKESVIDGDIYCFGGAGLGQSLMSENLVDEYYLMITPIILGNGKRLFDSGLSKRNLELIEEKTLDVGSVILHYKKT